MNLGISAKMNPTLPILGIAFSDKEISAAVFPEKDTEPIASVTQVLTGDIIKNGDVKDESKVAVIIRSLIKSLPIHSSLCVISIPTTLTYSTIFRLPQPLQNPTQIKGAAKLLMPSLLPWKISEALYDFRYHLQSGVIAEDKTIQEDRTIINLLAAHRNTIDTYTRIILSSGLTPIALESDAMSQVRLLETPPDEYTVTLTTGETHAYLSVGQNSEADFAFAFPLSHASEMSALTDEAEHLRMFAENELGVDIRKGEGELSYRLSITDRLPRGATSPTSYAAVGAALRGVAITDPKGNVHADQPSLLDLDPSSIAGFEKLTMTLKLARVVGIAIVVIYVVINSIALFTFSKATSSIVAQTPEQGILGEINSMEAKFTQVSGTFAALDAATKGTMRWSDSLVAIDSAFTPGVIPMNMSADNSSGPFQVTGISGTRAQFNQFRDALPKNPSIKSPHVPLGAADIELRIPFSAVLFPNIADSTDSSKK